MCAGEDTQVGRVVLSLCLTATRARSRAVDGHNDRAPRGAIVLRSPEHELVVAAITARGNARLAEREECPCARLNDRRDAVAGAVVEAEVEDRDAAVALRLRRPDGWVCVGVRIQPTAVASRPLPR